jgi:hypothetical protein
VTGTGQTGKVQQSTIWSGTGFGFFVIPAGVYPCAYRDLNPDKIETPACKEVTRVKKGGEK